MPTTLDGRWIPEPGAPYTAPDGTWTPGPGEKLPTKIDLVDEAFMIPEFRRRGYRIAEDGSIVNPSFYGNRSDGSSGGSSGGSSMSGWDAFGQALQQLSSLDSGAGGGGSSGGGLGGGRIQAEDGSWVNPNFYD